MFLGKLMITDQANDIEAVNAEIDRLVSANRSRCFWFMREDYFPGSYQERLQALDYLEERSDRALFKEVRRLREWLLRLFKEKSAPS